MDVRQIHRRLHWVAAVAVIVAPLSAQVSEFRATISGGRGDRGKCTIEVEVDGSADVEIRGDRGVLRTLTGRAALWRRFVRNGAIGLPAR